MRHKVEPTVFLAYSAVLSLLFILMDIPTHVSIGVAAIVALFLSIKIKY